MPTVIPENRVPTHPGVILAQEFLAPAGHLPGRPGGPPRRARAACQRAGARQAWRRPRRPPWLLAQALNTTPEYWVNLQTAHDLARSRPATPVEPLNAAS